MGKIFPYGNGVVFMEEEKLYVVAHPMRLRILRVLEREGSLYVNQIVEKLKGEGVDVDRKLVSYHLSRLLQYGLVEGEFKLMNPSKGYAVAVKYFRLTDEARRILSRIRNI
jgi:DNA-binding transcriptional ArsR family regulator